MGVELDPDRDGGHSPSAAILRALTVDLTGESP
jgi:hypothetical protein